MDNRSCAGLTGPNDMLQQNSKLLTTLLEVSNLVTSTMELRPLLEAILDKLRTIIEYRDAKIFISQGDRVSIIAHRSKLSPEQERKYPLPLEKEILRNPVVISDLWSDDELAVTFRNNMHEYMDTVFRDARCWMSLPMVYKDTVIGIMTLDHTVPGYYSDYHIELGTAFANQAAIEYENAKLYDEVKRRLQENEQRRRVAEGLKDIMRALNSDRSLEDILGFIIRQAATLLRADASALFRLDSEKGLLYLVASYGLPHLEPLDSGIGFRVPILQEAFAGRKPIVKTDPPETERSYSGHPLADAHLKWLRDNNCRMTAVPLICRDEVYGGIVLYFKSDGDGTDRDITNEDLTLAMSFADQAALAIDNTRLRKQAEETAVLAERNRLARDLHDAVTQTLFSASIIAEVIPKLWDRNREEGMKRLEELKQLTRGALAEMRTLLFELRPATLVEAPIEDLLRQLGEAVTGRARIPVKLDIKAAAKLPAEVKVVFYRVAQEALNNIAKHSGAKNAAVELSVNEDPNLGIIVASLRVSDDGKGFELQNVNSGRFGLSIMKERAEAAGARISIKSKPGCGTKVELEWVGTK
ncbi:MAG TPA: GAF domain-containing protein [Clostridiales bacterium]|nr:GAF domain-containing protein [Clostridiales bacterium]HPV00928.1 GAF domain-containing protein [Clostridiales bacterium]